MVILNRYQKGDIEDIQNSYGWLQARLANVNLPVQET